MVHSHGSPKTRKNSQKKVSQKRFWVSVKKNKSTKQKDKTSEAPQTCSIFGFWHNPHVNLIPTFPSLSFLMTQRDSNIGEFTVTACWDSSNIWEDTSLSLRLPGCFPSGGNNSSSATHHQPVIKPFGLSTGNSPLKTPSLQSHLILAKLLLQPAKGESSPGNPSIPETAPTPQISYMWSPHLQADVWEFQSILKPYQPDLYQRSLSILCLFFYRYPLKCWHSKPSK